MKEASLERRFARVIDPARKTALDARTDGGPARPLFRIPLAVSDGRLLSMRGAPLIRPLCARICFAWRATRDTQASLPQPLNRWLSMLDVMTVRDVWRGSRHRWQGLQESNLFMVGPKATALPLC